MKTVSKILVSPTHGLIKRSGLHAFFVTEVLNLPYPVQGRGTVESLGSQLYRVCGPAGCTVVQGLSNALSLSRNVPESDNQNEQSPQKPVPNALSMK